LTKAMESLAAKFARGKKDDDGGGGAADGVTPKVSLPGEKRRKRGEEDEGPDYLNPYIVQSLMRNPVGALQSLGTGWMAGGSGAGMKAPGGLMDMLKGSGGTFEPGKALMGNIGESGPGAASTYASTGSMAAAGIAVVVGSILSVMKMQEASANDRIKDSQAYVQDLRFGRGMGMDWRLGTWGTDEWMSRRDINQKQVQSIFGSAGVGLKNFGGAAGEWNKATLGQEAVDAALNAGISNEKMGAMIGMGVRMGTFSMGGSKEEIEDYRKYLRSIENWVRISAEHGISSDDSLKNLAQASQYVQRGSSVLTDPNRLAGASYLANITDMLPKELKQQGGVEAMQALTAGPGSDIQKVQFMNEFLTPDGTIKDMKLAEDILGPGTVQNMLNKYGKFGHTLLARKMAENGRGALEARRSITATMRKQGFDEFHIQNQIGVDEGVFANVDIGSAEFERQKRDLTGKTVGLMGQDKNEQDLTKYAERTERLSGVLVTSADAVKAFGNTMTRANREVVQFLDTIRMGGMPVKPLSPQDTQREQEHYRRSIGTSRD
jgi:hypothetical protein